MRTWAHDVKKGTFRSPWFNNIARSVLCQYGYQNSEEYQTNFDWTDLKRCKINSIQHFWPVMIDIQSRCRATVCLKQAADWLWDRLPAESPGGPRWRRGLRAFLFKTTGIFPNLNTIHLQQFFSSFLSITFKTNTRSHSIMDVSTNSNAMARPTMPTLLHNWFVRMWWWWL